MIKTLNTFTRLHCQLNDRLIKFMTRCPLVDGKVLHKKALGFAKSLGFDSYVGSFAGLWALLSKTSIKFSRVMGTLPENNAYYDDEEDDGLVEEQTLESQRVCNVEQIEVPEDSVDIIEYLPEDTEEYVMEMVPTDNMTEEIVFLDEQTFHYDLEDQVEERGTKRSIDGDVLYTTTIKRGRIDGHDFDEVELQFP